MRVPINLASRPYENLRPLYLGAATAAVLLAVLSLIALWRVRQNHVENRFLIEKNDRMEKSLAGLRREQMELEQWLMRPEVQQIRQRSVFLNSIIVRKSLSWTRMFMDLEKILPERVQVTAIRHSLNQSRQAELNLTVGSASVQPLVELLKILEMSPQFGTPVVDSQRFPAEKSTDPNILLDLSVEYHQTAEPASAPQFAEPASTPPAAAAATTAVPATPVTEPRAARSDTPVEPPKAIPPPAVDANPLPQPARPPLPPSLPLPRGPQRPADRAAAQRGGE